MTIRLRVVCLFFSWQNFINLLADATKERPKLSLKPRSVPLEEGSGPAPPAPIAEVPTPVASERPPAAPVSSAAIFGLAKPVDTAARERAIEERLKEKQMKDREPIRGRETDRNE